MLKEFIIWAKNNDWKVIENPEKAELPEVIKSRYTIPDRWYGFICKLGVCENNTQTKWFLTPKDYMPHEDGFRWNEFEVQSLECCDNASEIISYWSKHLTIFLSVEGEYYYYAINTDNGNVVQGYEPEYELSEVVAEDFDTFIRKVISGEIVL